MRSVIITHSVQYAVNSAGPWSTVCSMLLAANSAFSIFAVTAQECLGKRLFIDALDEQLLLRGWGWVVVFIFSA